MFGASASLSPLSRSSLISVQRYLEPLLAGLLGPCITPKPATHPPTHPPFCLPVNRFPPLTGAYLYLSTPKH